MAPTRPGLVGELSFARARIRNLESQLQPEEAPIDRELESARARIRELESQLQPSTNGGRDLIYDHRGPERSLVGIFQLYRVLFRGERKSNA